LVVVTVVVSLLYLALAAMAVPVEVPVDEVTALAVLELLAKVTTEVTHPTVPSVPKMAAVAVAVLGQRVKTVHPITVVMAATVLLLQLLAHQLRGLEEAEAVATLLLLALTVPVAQVVAATAEIPPLTVRPTPVAVEAVQTLMTQTAAMEVPVLSSSATPAALQQQFLLVLPQQPRQ
jgi:hypothetical protein